MSFFALTYAINFAVVYGSLYLFPIPYPIVWFFSIFSPSISAIAISGLIGGMAEIKKLLSGFLRFKAGFMWYLAAFSLTLIPLLLSLIYRIAGYPAPGMAPGTTVTFLLTNAVFILFSGPLAEEAGWRGFALPRMLKRFGALNSGVILGLIWAFWHIPFYARSGAAGGLPFPIYLVMVIVISIFITWIYINTGGSLALCVIAHFCFNFDSAFVAGYLGLLPQMVFNIGCGTLLGIYVVVVVIVFGPKHLTRKAIK